ncbi:38021_t:CDS:2, partial [Gigaspora margarita]
DKNFDQIIQIIEQLVNKYEKNFKPGQVPDNNTAIFKSIDIYLNDLEQDIIDLACDVAIFARTKSYTNKNITCRFILEQ